MPQALYRCSSIARGPGFHLPQYPEGMMIWLVGLETHRYYYAAVLFVSLFASSCGFVLGYNSSDL